MNRLVSAGGPAILAVMAALCVYWSLSTGVFDQRLWLPDVGSNGLLFLVLAAAVATVALVSHRLRLPPALVLATAGSVLSAAFIGPGPVAATLLILASAFCAGGTVLAASGREDGLRSGAMTALATALGLAFFSFLISILSFLPLNNPAVYLSVVLVPFFIRPRANWQRISAAWREARAEPPVPAWDRVFTGLTALALAVQLMAVLKPEVGADALSMHLHVFDQLREHGRFPYDVTQFVWSAMPLGVDWVYSLGAMLSGEPAARLLNFSAELLLVALLYSYVAGAAGTRAASLSVVLYVSTPLLYLESTSLYVENLWALWLVGALVCSEAFAKRGGTAWIVAAGVLLGAALSAKVITTLAAPLFLASAVMMVRNGFGARGILLLVVLAFVFGALPYANAWLRTGNPVFPFMNHVFQSPLFPPSGFNNPLYNHPFDWRTLYNVTFDSTKYLEGRGGGAIGLLWICVLPATAVLAWGAGRRWGILFLLSLAFVATVFVFQSYLRYVLPAFVLLAGTVGASMGWLGNEARWKNRFVAVLFAAGSLTGVYLYPSATWYYPALTAPPFPSQRDDFFKHGYEERLMPDLIRRHEFKNVLWLGRPLYAGTDARMTVVTWVSPGSNEAYRSLEDIAEARRWISALGVDAIVLATNNKACDRAFFCDYLSQHTSPVFSSGRVSLLAVKPAAAYGDELLSNPGFDEGTTGWWGRGIHDAATTSVLVDNHGAFRQGVAVVGGRRYLMSVTARCLDAKAPYRLQVNWMDGRKLLSSYVRVATCGDAPAPASDVVQAPPGASQAIVFASGHRRGLPVAIEAVSFKE